MNIESFCPCHWARQCPLMAPSLNLTGEENLNHIHPSHLCISEWKAGSCCGYKPHGCWHCALKSIKVGFTTYRGGQRGRVHCELGSSQKEGTLVQSLAAEASCRDVEMSPLMWWGENLRWCTRLRSSLRLMLVTFGGSTSVVGRLGSSDCP